VGYEKIPATGLSPFSKTPEINKNFYAAERVREELVQEGYSEVFTSVFSEQGERAVLNKVDSVRPFLRSSLIPGLTSALEKNKPNKDLLGLKEIKLFEIGVVWKGGEEQVMVGTIGEKESVAEKILETADAAKYEDLPLSTAKRYQAFSRYPYVVRDIAMWTPKDSKLPTEHAPDEYVLNLIRETAGGLALKVWLFDRFEKEGKISLAFRLIFQSFERTLTEEEVHNIMKKVSATLKSSGFEIR
jgi:phenylalanyl-tRNA synthetase beta subunit